MSICLLVRHGETDWNRSGRVMGHQPIPLNQSGERQARELVPVLRHTKIAGIYSSPVLRAVQTAQILSEASRADITLASGLSEIGVGEWMNRFWHELADDPVKRDWYTNPREARPPGGETLEEVQRRAVSTVEEIRSFASDGLWLFVSHADVIRTILAHYLDMDLVALRRARIDNASATGLEITTQGNQLLFLNYRPRESTIW
jgi:broad specificity phosphatase PhoE